MYIVKWNGKYLASAITTAAGWVATTIDQGTAQRFANHKQAERRIGRAMAATKQPRDQFNIVKERESQ